MQKKIIVVALAAAIALPVSALADTANVTIYGVADASLDMTDTGNTSAGVSGTTTHKISSNTSKIGFKGDESLGDGLKAVWQIESEVDLDGTTAAGTTASTLGFGSRNTFAGLQGDSWGSLILGRYDTPYKTSDRRLDLFGDHIADNRALMGGGIGKGSADTKGFDRRITDIAVYNSPMMSGFKLTAGYVAGAENATKSTDSKGRILSLAGTYDVAPFFGVLAYQKNDYGTAATGVVVAANGASANTSERAWKLGGGYKVDQFAVNAVYEKTDDNFKAGGGSLYGHRAFYIAGQFNVTPSDALKLAYTKTNSLDSLSDTGARHTSVGYNHKMSARTNLYATYTKLNNDKNINYSLNGEGAATGNVIATGNGASPTAFSLGMMHTF